MILPKRDHLSFCC